MVRQLDIEYIKSLVDIQQVKNKIICDASAILPYIENILAFYLVFDNVVIEKNSTYHTAMSFLTKHGSGVYTVQVFYFDQFHERKFVNIDINIQHVQPKSPVELAELVVVEQNSNQILCNAALLEPFINQIISYAVYRSNKLIVKKKFNLDEYVFTPNEDGCCQIKVEYEDLDGVIQYIATEFEFQRQSSEVMSNFAAIKISSSLSLIYNIIYAFVIREFQRKYDKGYFRYFSIILGPAVQLGIMVLIFSLMGMKAVLGLSIPLFVLTGLIPYNLFTTSGNCLTIVQSNRALLTYKQVKIIDTIFASMLMEFLLSLVIFFSGLLICKYVGLQFTIYNPLSLLLAFFMLFLLTLGVAMILSVVGFYFAEFNYAIQVIFRALFYVSGVFFSIENVPVQYQKYFLWNPLFQLIEFIRFSLISFKLPTELSYLYVIKSALFCFMLGAMLYFVNRHKFMVNDRARI